MRIKRFFEGDDGKKTGTLSMKNHVNYTGEPLNNDGNVDEILKATFMIQQL